MASTKIRGITIELGADTSGLSKALKGVNTEIKSTQKQLKDVERLLKLDPGNTELLEQKQRLLGQTVEQTSKKLDALKEAQKQVSDEMAKTGQGQEQYDALAREIQVTEKELKEAKQAANDFNVTTEKIAASATKLAGKFDTVAQKTRTLSKVAGGVLASMGALAIKTAQDADELNTLSKQTGIATDELQKMKYASDLIDVDVDDIVGAMKKLKKAVAADNDAFETLGVKTKDIHGNYRDLNDIFYAVVRRLSEIPNETERDIVAMELFGKSADDLAGIIDDGGEALKALGAEAESMGLIIPQDQIDKANEFNDAIDTLKAEATGTFAQIGTEIAEMLLPYLPEIKETIEGVLNALRDMDPDKLAFAAKCAAIVAAISPIATTASAVTTAVGNLTTALKNIGPETLGVLGIVGAVIAAFGIWGDQIENFVNNVIAKALDFLSTDWTETFGVMGEILNSFSATMTGILEGLKTEIHNWVDVYRGIFTGDWARVWEGAKGLFFGFQNAIVFSMKAGLNELIGIVNSFIEGLNQIKLPGFMGGYQVSIPKIPYLAEGGTISNGSAIVGEAGAEILTVSGGSATVTPLSAGGSGGSDVLGLLETYLPYLASGNTIVMDSGALVGSIAPDMNAALGTIAIRGGHR